MKIQPGNQANPLLFPVPLIYSLEKENQTEEEAENQEEIHLNALARFQVRKFPRPRLNVIRIEKYWRG